MDIYFTLFVLTVALMAAAGAMLLLVGYIDSIPAAIAHGWRWALPAVLLPVAGPIYFCFRHRPDCAKTGKQLVAGSTLLLLALAGLYGIGPWFARRALEMAGS